MLDYFHNDFGVIDKGKSLMSVQATIDLFLEDYAINHAQKSCALKAHALAQWLIYQQGEQGDEWQRVTHKSLQAYIKWRLTENFKAPYETLSKLSIATLHTEVSALRVFFSWALEKQWINYNPAKLLKLPKKAKLLPKVIEVDHVQKLFQKNPDNPLEIRDLAIVELFYSSGLRLAELAALNLNELDLIELEVRVISGKFGKDRVLPLGRKAALAIKKWLELRHLYLQGVNGVDEQAVFLSRNGDRLCSRQIAKRIKEWALKSDLGVNLHPHLLRHCMATHVLESSQDIRSVQELLGHSDISSTQIYTHLDYQHLAKIYDQAHPRAHKKKAEDVKPEVTD